MTMTVRQMIEWMSTFEDQDAIVKVVVHDSDGGYYAQGGTARVAEFDPEQHVEYTDYRGNRFVREHEPHFNRSQVVFGEWYG